MKMTTKLTCSLHITYKSQHIILQPKKIWSIKIVIISAGCILMLVQSHVHDCYIIDTNTYYLANINIKAK